MSEIEKTKVTIMKVYLWVLGIFVLFWWPLSHWLYPDWYHRFMGFEHYDYSLVKIIGTVGLVVVLNIFIAAFDPVRNRILIPVLIVFSASMAATYVFLIHTKGFPATEYLNVSLLCANVIILSAFFPPGLPVRGQTEHSK
jgi:hypothetical protein